ncbi:Rv1733c family protein [Pseudonocardia hydrocarbonoxydans]|uniref:Rv1733c family protein n=1 Tax=Pseudonocardia hydrocarbonoxydans TaxID=76726 RepID=UPI0031D244D8
MTRRQQSAERRDDRGRRRFTDVVEDVAARVLTSLGAFLLVAAVLAGFAAYGATVEKGLVERATRTPTGAVLVEDTPVASGARGTAPGLVPVRATWTGSDGVPRTGQVRGAPEQRAGSAVTIWLDHDGRVVPPPVGEAEAVTAVGVAGAGPLLIGGLLLGGCWAAVRSLTGRVDAALWEREWAQIEPGWSGRSR